MAPLLRLGRQRPTTRRLFCLPHAGGGVSTYSQWWRSLPPDVEVLGVQLPGREARVAEPPLQSIAAMVATALPAIVSTSDQPYAIFGHSMGGLVAYELAIALQHLTHCRAPGALFISARRAPDVPEPPPSLAALPDEAFLAAVGARYGGVAPEVLEEPELLELLVPMLRADVRAVEDYVPLAGGAVHCPVHVFGGTHDRHPQPAELREWQRWVDDPIQIRLFDGDHFYIKTHQAGITEAIARAWPA